MLFEQRIFASHYQAHAAILRALGATRHRRFDHLHAMLAELLCKLLGILRCNRGAEQHGLMAQTIWRRFEPTIFAGKHILHLRAIDHTNNRHYRFNSALCSRYAGYRPFFLKKCLFNGIDVSHIHRVTASE